MTSTGLEEASRMEGRGHGALTGDEEGLEGVRAVFAMKGTMRSSAQGDANAPGSCLGGHPWFLFLLP